jgi:protein-tyrosine phosphatase
LMALGASESDVMTDYLRTNDFRGPANNAQLNALVGSGLLGKRIYLEPQLFERPEYLEGQLEELHNLYDTFENYAFEALGITAEQLAAIRENLRKG